MELAEEKRERSLGRLVPRLVATISVSTALGLWGKSENKSTEIECACVYLADKLAGKILLCFIPVFTKFFYSEQVFLL